MKLFDDDDHDDHDIDDDHDVDDVGEQQPWPMVGFRLLLPASYRHPVRERMLKCVSVLVPDDNNNNDNSNQNNNNSNDNNLYD